MIALVIEKTASPTPAQSAERLLRPAVRCPACSAPPRFRIPESARDEAMGEPPEKLKGTLQCHRRECQTIYPVRAHAYQWAA
jgi:hypothetical protein